ncbi:MauE/DoxX family redox-associated membrane protein [Planomonospora venezuelensis]|uniref:Methylamine utilisation protein MauE domain-containing protein n=1 Tax=Planomonospora venezuelensis TaxID=1999 RepID=A0A841CUB9_PLAVE|nr:MauE/DoxX family redox-associated membrane protein [Planomonospora venezuelensis]MBB5960909.1 hypothetical protein [Planomonospora venezuelensis]GIN01145.1 hypothetical protein Pve01_28030 [Planomonospora venezuelensis]
MTQVAQVAQVAQTQVWTAVAGAQLPVLGLLLALGALAKVKTVASGSQPGALSGFGPAVLLAERWQAPAMLGCAAAEAVLAGGLTATGHPFFRWGTIAFFAVSTYVLWELRRRRPDMGCGCFGDVSAIPVGVRSLVRTVALTAMAVGTLRAGPVTGWSVLAGISWIEGLAVAGGLLLVVALSPEVDEAAARLRHRAPCERRPAGPATAAARLRASSVWRSNQDLLSSTEPVDSWRELCWRFFVYPGRSRAGEPVDVVFAVHLSGRRPAVRVALVGADGRTVEAAPRPEAVPVAAGR